MEDNESQYFFKPSASMDVHAEEEEDDEEVLRRQEELKDLVVHAFENLNIENSASTFESTYEQSDHNNDDKNVQEVDSELFTEDYKNSDDAYKQLEVLYRVRVREIEKCNQELNATKEQLTKERNALSQRIMLLEADMKCNNISFEECQKLLVEQKRVNAECQQKIEAQNESISQLNIEKQETMLQLNLYKTNCQDLEQRLNLMQRGINTSPSEKQIAARYENEIKKLNLALENGVAVINKLEKEKSKQSNEISDLQLDKELQLAEKNDHINKITFQLQNMKVASQNLFHKINELEDHNKALEIKVKEYENKFSPTENEAVEEMLKADLKNLLKVNAEKEVQINKLKTELSKLETEKEIQTNQFKTELSKLDERCNKKSVSLEETEAKLHGVEMKSSEIRMKLQTKMKRNMERFRKIETAKSLRERSKFEKQLCQLASYKEKYDQKYNECEYLKKIQGDLNIIIENLQQKIVEYRCGNCNIPIDPEKNDPLQTATVEETGKPTSITEQYFEILLTEAKEKLRKIYEKVLASLVKDIRTKDKYIEELTEKCKDISSELEVRQSNFNDWLNSVRQENERVREYYNAREETFKNSFEKIETNFVTIRGLHDFIKMEYIEIKKECAVLIKNVTALSDEREKAFHQCCERILLHVNLMNKMVP